MNDDKDSMTIQIQSYLEDLLGESDDVCGMAREYVMLMTASKSNFSNNSAKISHNGSNNYSNSKSQNNQIQSNNSNINSSNSSLGTNDNLMGKQAPHIVSPLRSESANNYKNTHNSSFNMKNGSKVVNDVVFKTQHGNSGNNGNKDYYSKSNLSFMKDAIAANIKVNTKPIHDFFHLR